MDCQGERVRGFLLSFSSSGGVSPAQQCDFVCTSGVPHLPWQCCLDKFLCEISSLLLHFELEFIFQTWCLFLFIGKKRSLTIWESFLAVQLDFCALYPFSLTRGYEICHFYSEHSMKSVTILSVLNKALPAPQQQVRYRGTGRRKRQSKCHFFPEHWHRL